MNLSEFVIKLKSISKDHPDAKIKISRWIMEDEIEEAYSEIEIISSFYYDESVNVLWLYGDVE